MQLPIQCALLLQGKRLEYIGRQNHFPIQTLLQMEGEKRIAFSTLVRSIDSVKTLRKIHYSPHLALFPKRVLPQLAEDRKKWNKEKILPMSRRKMHSKNSQNAGRKTARFRKRILGMFHGSGEENHSKRCRFCKGKSKSRLSLMKQQ